MTVGDASDEGHGGGRRRSRSRAAIRRFTPLVLARASSKDLIRDDLAPIRDDRVQTRAIERCRRHH